MVYLRSGRCTFGDDGIHAVLDMSGVRVCH